MELGIQDIIEEVKKQTRDEVLASSAANPINAANTVYIVVSDYMEYDDERYSSGNGVEISQVFATKEAAEKAADKLNLSSIYENYFWLNYTTEDNFEEIRNYLISEGFDAPEDAWDMSQVISKFKLTEAQIQEVIRISGNIMFTVETQKVL